jgi:hypothetical protein
MAQGYSTVTDLNALFAEIYEDAIFVAREQSLMPPLVTNYVGSGMADRNMGIFPQLTATEVSEGVDYSNPTKWTVTSQMTITPKTAMDQVLLTDERITTDPNDARNSAAREMGGAIGTKIDTDLLALFSSLNSDLGAAGSSLTLKRCAASMAILRNALVSNPVQFVVHPYGWHDIWLELGQPSANQALLGDVANQALKDYFVGNFINANWFTSANISVDSSDDAVSGVFHREALALDTRRAPTFEAERDASLRAWELNLHVWYGVAVRRSTYGVALTHDATTPDGT